MRTLGPTTNLATASLCRRGLLSRFFGQRLLVDLLLDPRPHVLLLPLRVVDVLFELTFKESCSTRFAAIK